MAFFPCVRFEVQIIMGFKGTSNQLKNYTDVQKMEYDLTLHRELTMMYELVTKLTIICLRKGLRLIIENPYSTQHYLTRYWAIEPKIIDYDRTRNGDYFKKPTQYWFINIEPKQNVIYEAIEQNEAGNIVNIAHCNIDGVENNKTKRSMINPTYANRFIRMYILDDEQQDNGRRIPKEDEQISIDML